MDDKECKTCGGTGSIFKTEWVGENESFDVQIRCPDCND